MPADWPAVVLTEEVMREGMQIESAEIPVERKVELLDALSETGLRRIVVGSFVSPRWTPQMREIDRLVSEFRPRPGVTYLALALNEKGRERAQAYSPPLTVDEGPPMLRVHLCDVFVKRNTNRTQGDELAAWPRVVAAAQAAQAPEAGIAINAAWGSNWTGAYSIDDRFRFLESAHARWDEAGIPVTHVWIGDPMGWALPQDVGETLAAIRRRWPEIVHFHVHLHDTRGLALASAYEALRTLDQATTLHLDSSLGGAAGCPYCGNGRAAAILATEDVVHFLEESGVDTGVDLDRLVDAVALAEEIVGHPLYGHVSKAGPRPHGPRLYPLDMPRIETLEEAAHFRLGPRVYAGQSRPWEPAGGAS